MKACQDQQETLLLDVYGELAPTEREAWQKHLEVCEGCRQERQQLLQFLQELREAMSTPTLSAMKAEALADFLIKDLKGEEKKRWWEGRLWGFPNKLVPAIAGACIMIVAFGWFSLRGVRTPSTFQAGENLDPEQKMMARDLEVIKNLEILEEMEVLEKLVRVVDERNSL